MDKGRLHPTPSHMSRCQTGQLCRRHRVAGSSQRQSDNPKQIRKRPAETRSPRARETHWGGGGTPCRRGMSRPSEGALRRGALSAVGERAGACKATHR